MGACGDLLTCARGKAALPDPRLDTIADTIDSDPFLTALWNGDPPDHAEDFPAMEELRRKLGPLHMGFFVFCLLRGLPETCRFYRSKGIPEEILRLTLQDIPRNMDEYEALTGKFGIGGERYPWLWNHIRGRLFQLGRLQFMAHVLEAPETFGGTFLPAGTKLLETHIPAGEPLLPEACSRAFRAAVEFYEKTFGYVAEGFTCESWLLSPELGEILPPHSNIRRFAGQFSCTDRFERDDSFLQYVFGTTAAKAEQLPENNSLQRGLKRFLLQGGELNSGYGFRPVG